MCKDHDLQHYSIDARNLAREITCGDPEMASLLLDHCTYDGLAAFMNQYEKYCEDERRSRIDNLMQRMFTQRRHKAISLAGEIINKWDIELDDVIPY